MVLTKNTATALAVIVNALPMVPKIIIEPTQNILIGSVATKPAHASPAESGRSIRGFVYLAPALFTDHDLIDQEFGHLPYCILLQRMKIPSGIKFALIVNAQRYFRPVWRQFRERNFSADWSQI